MIKLIQDSINLQAFVLWSELKSIFQNTNGYIKLDYRELHSGEVDKKEITQDRVQCKPFVFVVLSLEAELHSSQLYFSKL
jgi:hypothetical protein